MLTNKNRAGQAFSTLWTALLILVFTGCQPSGPKALLLGDKYVRQGEYQKALKFLARAALLLPEKPEVWNLQGLAYHGTQQPARAAEAYQRALRINRAFAPAHFNLGVLLLEQDRVADAITELTVYTSLQPNDDQGWARLGAALVRTRKVDEADRALSAALKLNAKNADAHNSLGLVHIQRKRPRDAMQSFNAALQFRPGFGAALLNQAIVAQQYFGNNQIALERYRAFLSTKPNAKAAAAVQVAIREIEHGSIETPNPVALADLTTNTGIGGLLRSNLAQAERARSDAIQTATSLVSQAVQNLKTNLALAPKTNVLPRAASPATNPPAVVATVPPKTNAVPAPEAVATPVPPVQVVAVNDEPELRVPKDIEVPSPASTNQHNQLLALNSSPPPDEPPLMAPRKRADTEKHGILSRLKQANPARWFESDSPKPVAVPPPRTVVAPAEQSDLAARVSPPVRPPPIARYEYRKNLNLAKGNRPQAQRAFAQGAAAHQQRRLPEAIALYRQAIAADPAFFEACYNLGLAAYQNQDLPLALAANEQAVALKPASADARYNFALTLRESRYFVDAANELRDLLNEAPNDPRAHLALGNLYSQSLDEPGLARSHYLRFLELAPNHPDAPSVRQLLTSR